MPALRPLPPKVFRQILEAKGWSVTNEDDYNWILAKGPAGFPVVVPRRVAILPLDVMMNVLERAEITDREFFDLLGAAGYAYPAEPFPPTDPIAH